MNYIQVLPDIINDIHNIIDNTGVNGFKSDREEVMKDGFLTWSQTNSGLILQYSYGIPEQIITPYGTIRISSTFSTTNQKCYEIIHKKITDLLSLTLYKDLIDNEYGSRGPWYKINNYNGMLIPDSNIIYPVTIKYKDAKSKFYSIFKNYQSS